MADSRDLLGAIRKVGESGSLDHDAIAGISMQLKVPVSKVKSVSSFYDFDAGEDKMCNGLPCGLNQDQAFLNSNRGRFKEEPCLGYCGHSPVFRINGKYFSRTRSVLTEIRESTAEYMNERREGTAEYLVHGGYSAMEQVLGMSDHSGVIEKVEKSGLRGMGGAGFPVARKWKSISRDRGTESYLLVNGHEGEPGTFKDRVIMELTPHGVVEGSYIVAIVNRLSTIVIALRADYRNAIASMERAMNSFRRRYEDLSRRIPAILTPVGGGYVTGEETALMESIEGRRGEPRLRPPFPTEKGLNGKPTLVHNPETLSIIPKIIASPGYRVTKSFCLTGDVKKPGIYHETLGISAEELLHDRGGTSASDLKAFFPGGLSGSVFPASSLSMKLNFDSVGDAGGGFGTGAFIGIARNRCMVDITKRVAKFFETESCGKCAPCRLGTKEISVVMQKLSSGKGTKEDLEFGKKVATGMIEGSICALGQVAGKTFIDAVTRFSEEFASHVKSACPEGVCRTEKP